MPLVKPSLCHGLFPLYTLNVLRIRIKSTDNQNANQVEIFFDCHAKIPVTLQVVTGINPVGVFQKPKSCDNKDIKGMEAGGFEPPSRDILGQASTCLVVHLNFAQDNAKRQALSLAISP